MREYRQFQRVRTRQERVRRAVMFMLIVIVAGVLALILRSIAHGQTNIGEPWCEISAPALPQSNPINCIQPRVYLPIVEKAH